MMINITINATLDLASGHTIIIMMMMMMMMMMMRSTAIDIDSSVDGDHYGH
jgi:hypothetical protein